METQKNYQQFDLEDFVSDDNFIRWAQGKSPESEAFWNNYISTHPAQEAIILEAKDLVSGFIFEQPDIDEDFFMRLNDRINLSLDQETTADKPDIANDIPVAAEQPQPERKNYKLAIRIATGIAASILIFLAFLFYPKEVTIENGFAGIKEVVLPDSSIVMLNANSKLSYAGNWNPHQREVKLTGEGFFRIRHRTENGKVIPFVVAANDLKLHVLGTSFNVINTPQLVQITLRTGKLKVTHDQDSVFMKPEDQLAYDLKKKSFSLQRVSDNNYMDWTKLEFVFNDLSIDLVTQKLAAYFDIRFHFDDPAVKQEMLSGRLDLSNQKETLHTLELLLNKKIEIKGREVTINR